jgi:peroxiredoxin
VKRTSLSRIVCGLLALTVVCGVAGAEIGARAPQFSGQTLDGRTFNNDSFRGRALLLEFWATRCPQCGSGQAAVNNIARKYAGERLVVLGIDVGEPEATVRKFLKAHPASCPVALDADRKISARFGKHGLPYYVMIDRDGFIAGTKNGPVGEDALVSLLSLAGLPGSLDQPSPEVARLNAPPETQADSATQESAAPATAAPGTAAPATAPATAPEVIEVPQEEDRSQRAGKHSAGRPGSAEAALPEKPAAEAARAVTPPEAQGEKAVPEAVPAVTPPMIIEVPQEPSSAGSLPPKPSPKTVFVLANGERLEADHYTMEEGVLHIVVAGEPRAIPLRALDAKATIAANRERGIDLKIPQSRSEVYVAF